MPDFHDGLFGGGCLPCQLGSCTFALIFPFVHFGQIASRIGWSFCGRGGACCKFATLFLLMGAIGTCMNFIVKHAPKPAPDGVILTAGLGKCVDGEGGVVAGITFSLPQAALGACNAMCTFRPQCVGMRVYATGDKVGKCELHGITFTADEVGGELRRIVAAKLLPKLRGPACDAIKGGCAAVVDEITKPDKLKWAELPGKKVSEYKEGRPFEHYRKQTFPTASPTNSITFASEAMMRYKRPKECKRKDAKAAKGKGLTKITEAEACCGAKLGQMKWNREGEATKFFKARAFLGRANGMRIALGIITFFLVCAMRGRVRRISGIPGGPCGDGCSTLFCFSCTLAQMARHTMQYDKNPDWRCGTGGIGACCVDPGPMDEAP